ncbi:MULTISPECIES: FtsK/SpoIIIE domain-containing protein [Cyanophyceae]|uniref:FtsK/SpoIIIE domain-containing protein n=1 Tax=Cyanophyceae TaxID=3028117 RepID=UPI001683E395|nr:MULTISPECIES: FtsK/SpoIIIE domain-containing protein [Cyanophyceae]MBD1915010.1 DNA translocase FtsK [Phormidium sp. FACHB-77]MBD2032797.1 DNA translocase FtsK [Phormidium sp. FACHB-322]MBD2049942.1 DNA translocase FtsK [Leptolyngbya sp. FACHB-60]
MKTIELIGQVAADFLKRSIQTDETNEGVARFLLNRLTAQQVAAVCQTILHDSELAPLIKIQVPRDLVGSFSLPAEVLTDERTVHLRHSDCDRPALLLANISDDQAQSLNDITSVGAQELKGQIESWISLAAKELAIPVEQIEYWRKALNGLQKVGTLSLEHFADYIIQTRSRILQESLPVVNALGWALPALRLPRDSGYFCAIPETQLGQTQRWEKLFQQAFAKRECLLLKQTPNRKPIDEHDLQTAFDKVKDDIPAIAYPAIQAFIASSTGWTSEAQALAEFEWESENVNTLFSGLKTQTTNIGSLTLDFFRDEYPDVLTEEENQYIKALVSRKKEALDEDREFYDSHRHEFDDDQKLKAKWDKFVYGQPIECTDFLVGLLLAFERLFAQVDSRLETKRLKISTRRGIRPRKWIEELNSSIGLYFCTRYRGIEQLTSPHIIWETEKLFEYDSILKENRNKKKYRENTSASRTATEIKFYVEMLDGEQKSVGTPIQLIWKCNPNSIGIELNNDLNRLIETSSFQISSVAREVVSKKGRLQGIALSDVGTLAAVYRRDRVSLVSKYSRKSDLDKTLPEKLEQAVADGRLSKDAAETITVAWKTFAERYRTAIASFNDEGQGIASPDLLHQCEAYGNLLQIVLNHAKGDLNRIDIYQPILRLGCIRVERGNPAAIIAPWHPMRLASLAVKARQLSGLLRYIISTPEVNFGDSRLFFADLRNEIEHPYYPEVCVGYQGQQPELLSVSDTVNDYSLMERPTQDESDRTTNENPAEAADRLLGIIRRYVELLPHEKTNLSVVLYQTDSIKLPQAIVNKLSEELQDGREEVRCQVILRHRNRQKLAQLYGQMLESSAGDPDAFIASEVSQDFMARLRISVMSNDVPSTTPAEGKFADIVFLQDAISRQAKVVWQPSPFDSSTAKMLIHSPARWARKRPSAKDELKSTVYLTCPKQTGVGQAYLDMVYSIAQGEDCSSDQHFLPARQISFQDETTRTTFDESHRLGEWVVNYDDLLERRQLVNQGVKVIRYQQNRTDERNFLVSSDASLNVLKVLVRKRLEALNLGLESNRIDRLVERLINEANAVSGDIVLRAAKCGRYASELMGVVLSKALITAEMGAQNPIGWYFLDDYASWLGQKEGQIADTMAISPQYVDDEPVLKVIIAEAKYIDVAGLADARKTSQNQLRQTVDRIADALFISPGRLDRDLWLSRLSDLLLDGIEFSSDNKLNIEQWREQIRSGTLRIDLSGYSQVFVSGTNDSSAEGERSPIPKVKRCFQEVFDRESVRKLVLAYESGQTLFCVREQIGDDKPWTVAEALRPADRVTWVLEIEEVAATTTPPVPVKVSPPENPDSPLQLTLPDQPLEPEATISLVTSPTEDVDSWASPALVSWWQQGQAQSSQGDAEAEKWLEEAAGKLRTALLGYNLQAKIEGKRLTPNAAIVKFKGSDNLKLDDIEKKRSQLLTTHALNIISVYGQPGEIVVTVARPQRQTISLREVWAKRKINRSLSGVNLSFVVGVKELDGELLYLNLGSSFENLEQHAPHTLIAGATGSGKSVLLQNLLLDICATNSPKLASIYLIDPKMGVDYANISDLPHLKEGIIIEQDRAIEVLDLLVEEMDNRYRKFVSQKAKSLQDYNCKVAEQDRLPVLWLVHDEFAEWMLIDEYKAAVSAAVQRLGVKARAAGIYLIFAAQRPDANVLPVQLRDNLGNRLILRVESVGTSEISLGQKGAENLLGKGHLAARLTNELGIIYAQVPFLHDEDLPLLVESIKSNSR